MNGELLSAEFEGEDCLDGFMVLRVRVPMGAVIGGPCRVDMPKVGGNLHGYGATIGVLDKHGTPVRVGDRVRFDSSEFGGDCEFVVEIRDGEISYPGSPDDFPQFCEVIQGVHDDR